jgi:tetratricopeptide (TPR) repeat protein
VAGDVVNTASRMQGLAPPGGLVVGEVTQRLVRSTFLLEELPPAVVKGKTEPLRTWRVLGLVGSASGPRADSPALFVGRERELRTLLGLFERTRTEHTLGVVTVAGEAGMGKSRLVLELHDRLPQRTVWHESRCLPYGEQSALAPVARILTEAAGVQASDDAPTVAERITALAAATGSDVGSTGPGAGPTPAGWSAAPLLALAGVGPAAETDGGDVGSSTVPVAEIAMALAAVLRSSAPDAPPRVLCLQDVHWANDVVFELMSGLAGELARAPWLFILTTRPEALDRSAWPHKALGETVVRLAPLPDREIEQLMTSILSTRADGPAALPIQRAGGNPLYAVEFARLLAERESGGGDEGAAATPEGVQALIGARLDALPERSRSVVRHAAVAGSELWPDLIASLADLPPAETAEILFDLSRREVLRPVASTLPGHPAAFSFAHDLFREVAYARVPRSGRARDHVEAAAWIAAEAGERASERADALADHLVNAVQLGRAARDTPLVERAAPEAVRWLMVAGHRAIRVDPAGALALFDRAAELAADGSPQRADALLESGVAARRSGALEQAAILARYQEALDIHRSRGDPVGVGRALVKVGSQLGAMGETGPSRIALTEAVEVLGTTLPGIELATAYAYRAEDAMYAGRPTDSLRDAQRALEILADRPGAEDIVIMALHIRGDARCSRNDRGGLDDLRRALELAERDGSSAEVVTSMDYVAAWTWAYEGPIRALPSLEGAIRLAEARGMVNGALWATTESLPVLYELGEWDTLLSRAAAVLDRGRERLDLSLWVSAESQRARVLAARGRAADAIDPGTLMETARSSEGDLEISTSAFLACGALAAAAGDAEGTVEAMGRFERATHDAAPEYRDVFLADAVRTCLVGGAIEAAERLIAASTSEVPHHRCTRLSARAALAEALGTPAEAATLYSEAAVAWTAFGVDREVELARAGIQRCRTGAQAG